jgi:hypothetical protein
MILKVTIQVCSEELQKARRFLVQSYELLKYLDQRSTATLLYFLKGPK